LFALTHTKTHSNLTKQGRIFDTNGDNYITGKMAYQLKYMSPERLMELNHFARETLYKDAPRTQKIFNLLQRETK